MRACQVISNVLFILLRVGARSKHRGKGAKRRKRGRQNRKSDRGMNAQVLLLMDPGAELGWAVLSDTLPSAGEVTKRMLSKEMLQTQMIS